MTSAARSHAFETHQVTNQPPPLQDYNLFDSDTAMVAALRREGGGSAELHVRQFGALVGTAEMFQLGDLANRFKPELRTHDRYGHRIDEVEFHPAWHSILRLAMANEVHCYAWNHSGPGAHVGHSALQSMLAQVEAGTGCPLTMTFACVPALRHEAGIAAEWESRVLGTEYEPRLIPAAEKRAALVGMAMTEKQGGSDVRANTTRAHPLTGGGPGSAYELVGHKWFCSAPMSDAFLTLARTGAGAPGEPGDRGISCFLVPRFRPDGTRNPFRIQRLKDKVGNRSNASSEIEYAGTFGWMLGEEGRGIRTILEMVHHTRLDCVGGSTGLMRQALSQALHHAGHRSAFGRRLIEQPLMKNVLADLALESEAATALLFRLARAYDSLEGDPQERAFARIATAIGKYWVCKRAPHMIYEAMECLGGAGYVEESILPRLYREAPVNSIWEGSGNVMCLDVMRAMGREPETIPALLGEIRLAAGQHPALDRAIAGIEAAFTHPQDAEVQARQIVESLALALQASLLLRGAPPYVADAFCEARLGDHGGLTFGTLPPGVDVRSIVERATPRN